MCTQVPPTHLAESQDDIPVVDSCQIDLKTHSILDSLFSEISSVNDVTGAHSYIGGTEMKETDVKAFNFILCTLIDNSLNCIHVQSNFQEIDSGFYTITFDKNMCKYVLDLCHWGGGLVKFGCRFLLHCSNFVVRRQLYEQEISDRTRNNYYLKSTDTHCLKDNKYYEDIIDAICSSISCADSLAKESRRVRRGPLAELYSKGAGYPENFSQECLSVCRTGDKYVPYWNTDDVGFLMKEDITFSFIGPDRNPQKISSIEEFITIADLVLETGKPNYMQARIPIASGLNIDKWATILKDFPNQKLIQYLQFGFPLSLTKDTTLCNTNIENHSSALHHPHAVDACLETEIAHGVIFGPTEKIDHPAYHCSPLLTRPKPPDKRRVIVDLSFPRGASVNDSIDSKLFDGHEFKLKLPTMDHIINSCKGLKDPVIAKIDISRAFRNIRVDPADAMKLGLKWRNKYFVDGAVVFGWLHGTAAFELCSSAIAKYFQSSGIIMYPYIDDFLYIMEAANAESQFRDAEALITALGLPVNYEKISYPNKTVTCLGIHIDLINNTLSIDADKLTSIQEHCDSIRIKKYISKRAYQSLLGKLFYIHKCVKPARIFMNRMLALFRANSHKNRIRLNNEFLPTLIGSYIF